MVVREVNEKTKGFGMMIRSATCEISGGKFYVCLINIDRQIMRKEKQNFEKKIIDTYINLKI